MATLKYLPPKPKFNIDKEKEKCHLGVGYPLISFGYVTTNKMYNFNFLKKNKQDNLKARIALDELLAFIGTHSWNYLRGLRKDEKGGFETIGWGQVQQESKISIPGIPMTLDTKVYVFRFGGKYRMLGVKTSKCHELKIIAYDFNYNLYNHGS